MLITKQSLTLFPILQLKMQNQDPTVSFCPSFSSYSSDLLSAIADRVTDEESNKLLVDGNGLDERDRNDNESTDGDGEDDHDDFEFVLVRANPNDCTAISGGGGDNMMASYPVFPLFNRDLLLDYEDDKQSTKDRDDEMASAIPITLGKLFIEDRDPPSSSSSEADELDGISPGTYCVWTPTKSPSASPLPSRCKKSNSTGSSSKQKWRLRDLLHLRRCSSDGKESFIFYHPDNNNLEKKKEGKGTEKDIKKAGKAKEKVSAHEVFYVRNKALKEGDKRRSYLPYRQGLVGIFANVNGFGRAFSPF